MPTIFKLEHKFQYVAAVILAAIIILIILGFRVINNEGNYHETIAKVISVSNVENSKVEDMNQNVDHIIKQKIQAVITNGSYKGEKVNLQNTTSYSQVYDLNLKPGDEVFISIRQDSKNKIASAQVIDYKRDKYLAGTAVIFLALMIIIGQAKGLKSLASVAVNIIIAYIVVKLYLAGFNLIAISLIASILFIVISIFIVSGINEKSYSAILSTVVSTAASTALTAVVIFLTHSNGIHYEEMEFLTKPPEQIFFAEIMIGTLGAIMDIAISISSAVSELYDKNPCMSRKELIKSGTEIGQDIMGTMANTLVFAYIGGSMPMILLWLKNSFSIFYIIHIDICLEIIRALTGSIGIAMSIPITLYVTSVLFKSHKIGDKI